MSKEKKSKLYTQKYMLTVEACRVQNGLYNEFIVRRGCANIFQLKYYLEHYKDVYGEDFEILRVLKKEKIYD